METRKASANRKNEPGAVGGPTPIRISKRAGIVIALAVFFVFAAVVYLVPDVLTTTLGGFALALVLSFPVRFLSHFMPRGLAILLSFLLAVGLVVLAALLLVPIIVEQFVNLVRAVPSIASDVERYVNSLLDFLRERGILSGNPEPLVSRLTENLPDRLMSIASGAIGGVFGFLSGTFSFVLTLFGVVFIGAYLLIDVRKMKAAFLRVSPRAYRSDARDLWNDFGSSLSRYLSGLLLILLIQGAVSAVGLWLLGVPYALALGAFVSVTAVIPYLGAWLGAIPAVIVAFTVSPTTALLTAVLFLGIQQLEGNLLTPKIQGDTLRVHPILVFLAVIVGGGLAGILGVLVAVPALAVVRVLFDFFRDRLQTK